MRLPLCCQACAPESVNVVSPSLVQLGGSSTRETGRKAPLLLLELAISADGRSFGYTTPLDAIHARILAAFDRALAKLQGLPQLEPAVMDKLFWPTSPLLSAVHPQEEVAARARDALSGCLLAALQPLRRCVPDSWADAEAGSTAAACNCECMHRRKQVLPLPTLLHTNANTNAATWRAMLCMSRCWRSALRTMLAAWWRAALSWAWQSCGRRLQRTARSWRRWRRRCRHASASGWCRSTRTRCADSGRTCIHLLANWPPPHS